MHHFVTPLESALTKTEGGPTPGGELAQPRRPEPFNSHAEPLRSRPSTRFYLFLRCASLALQHGAWSGATHVPCNARSLPSSCFLRLRFPGENQGRPSHRNPCPAHTPLPRRKKNPSKSNWRTRPIPTTRSCSTPWRLTSWPLP